MTRASLLAQVDFILIPDVFQMYSVYLIKNIQQVMAQSIGT